jgi:hypothetical protein
MCLFFACPHNFDAAFNNNPAAKTAAVVNDLANCSAQTDAFFNGGIHIIPATVRPTRRRLKFLSG